MDATAEIALKSIKAAVCESIRLVPAGADRYRILSPFVFDDGDHLTMVLKREPTGWVLSDEAHTLMRLGYKMESKDIGKGTRAEVIDGVLGMFGVTERDGELRIAVEGEEFGGPLYSLAQAIIRVSDVTYLSREVVRSTFLDDFRSLMSEAARDPVFDWRHPNDAEGHYTVDCFVDGDVPLYVFALVNEDRVRDATIAILTLEKDAPKFRSVGVFQDQETVARKVLARFSDVADRQFSNLDGNRERIISYVRQAQSLG